MKKPFNYDLAQKRVLGALLVINQLFILYSHLSAVLNYRHLKDYGALDSQI